MPKVRSDEMIMYDRWSTGFYAEMKVSEILREHGFVVFRHPHSATPDIWAWRDGVLFLIEVKSTLKSSVTVNPEQVSIIRGLLQFFANTSICAVGFVVVYFLQHDEFGVKRIDPLDNKVLTVRLGDHEPELPL